MRPVPAVVQRRCLSRLVHDLFELPLELLDLGGDRPAARFELQQHRLSGLAEEPNLPRRRVVPDPVSGDCERRLSQQVVALDDDELVDGLVDDHVQASETAGPGLVDELERRSLVGGDDGGASAS